VSYAGKCPECGFPFEDHEFACAECSTVFNPVAIMESGANRKSEVEKLRDQNAELRARLSQAEECLKPFAGLAAYWMERDDVHGIEDDTFCATEIEFGHLRAADRYFKEREAQNND
jgi:uncharacterized Zn finger protein (UPF0148 family)